MLTTLIGSIANFRGTNVIAGDSELRNISPEGQNQKIGANIFDTLDFGPAPRLPLPFTCRMLADTADDDVEIIPSSASVGQYEVIFPMGL